MTVVTWALAKLPRGDPSVQLNPQITCAPTRPTRCDHKTWHSVFCLIGASTHAFELLSTFSNTNFLVEGGHECAFAARSQ